MDRDSSSQTPSGHSQPSSGNTPQRTASISHPSQSQPAPESTTNPVNSKRRRGLGVVTPNACTECRKKRAKCDGRKPCGRCEMQQNVDCVYEIPVRQSKETLRGELENMRQHQRSSDAVFAALRRPDVWEEVLRRLRAGQSVNSISKWLNGNEPPATVLPPLTSIVDSNPDHGSAVSSVSVLTRTAISVASNSFERSSVGGPSIENISPLTAHPPVMMNEMGHSSTWHFTSHTQAESVRRASHADALNWQPNAHRRPHSRVMSWAESMRQDQATKGMPRYRGLEEVLSPLGSPGLRSPTDTWTKITGDINLVQHLLALYFCWEYPTFASLSKEHFLLDFQAGRYRYCSPMLVNALLALGCRFSSHPMTRANPDNPYSSGDHFFKESQRLFNQETDHHSLTTIQALGIMSIREASCGRDSESWYYAGQSIRLAIEMGLHRVHDDGDEDELAVQAATFWGPFALDHAWSLATGSLPQCSCLFHLPHKPAIIGDIEASLWVPYTDDGAPLQRSCEQPSNVRSVYTCFCELSELVHQSLYVLHSPGKPVTARELLSIYTQYLNWYDQIPEVLRLGQNFTPAVLFAHMYYHFAILLLFRPLIRLRIIGSKVLPRDVCLQAADAIQGILTSYSQLYTLQRTPSFVPYFVLTSAIMHLAIGASAEMDGCVGERGKAVMGKSRVPEALKQGIADLTQMAPCHHFAEQALNILRYLAKEWNIDVGSEDQSKLDPDEHGELDQPYTRSIKIVSSSLETGHFLRRWGTGLMPRDGAPDVTVKSAENMENLLSSPFPLQGRPMLPQGRELELAGFVPL